MTSDCGTKLRTLSEGQFTIMAKNVAPSFTGTGRRQNVLSSGRGTDSVWVSNLFFVFVRFMHRVSSRNSLPDSWSFPYVHALAVVVILLMCGAATFAYSVLTHEEIVDLLWTDEIRPLLLKRYPGTVGRPDQGGACLCLWGRRHPRSRLLPIRQHGIQQPGALRP